MLSLVLNNTGLANNIIEFLQACLALRIAHVAVGGSQSDEFNIENSVYQGTVLGPMLWNAFFMDVCFAARAHGGSESVFADDLSVFKVFQRHDPEEQVIADMERTRQRVRAWGVSQSCEI